MTALQNMTWDKWQNLMPSERDKIRDNRDLSPQLIGLEGWRVEVIDRGQTRRFIVGRSTGWRPSHLEIHNRRSSGGVLAEKHYQSVRKLYLAR